VAAAVATNASGQATFATAALAVGGHTVKATFSGTPVLAGSSDSITQTVDKISTTTMLASSSNPSVSGDSVTFTAGVSTTAGAVSSGTVTFTIDGGTQSPIAVDASGNASLTTSALAVGSHAIDASYDGTATLATSAATTLTQVVGKIATSTALVSSANPSLVAGPVTFTATVTAAGSPVTAGTVTFTVDGAAQPPAGVNASGQASLTTASLAVGSHAIAASFDGTATLATSTATPLTQNVGPIAAAGGPYTVAEGGSLSLDATGSGTGAGVSYAWDVNGDAVFTDASGLTPVLTWAQLQALGINDGPFSGTVAVKVAENGVSSTGSAALTVTNTAPTVTISGSLQVTARKAFTVKIGASDPSAADAAAMFGYHVDWGDGTPAVNATGAADPPFSHAYTTAGTYAALITATDKDGGTSALRSVTIVAAKAAIPPVTPTPTPPSSTLPGALPSTGASVSLPLWSAIVLLLAGSAVLFGATRLRRSRRY
jgi:hypothetical protein